MRVLTLTESIPVGWRSKNGAASPSQNGFPRYNFRTKPATHQLHQGVANWVSAGDGFYPGFGRWLEECSMRQCTVHSACRHLACNKCELGALATLRVEPLYRLWMGTDDAQPTGACLESRVRRPGGRGGSKLLRTTAWVQHGRGFHDLGGCRGQTQDHAKNGLGPAPATSACGLTQEGYNADGVLALPQSD